MSYTYRGKSPTIKTTDDIRGELENLNRLRAAILAETEAKAKELARIRAARLRLQPIATYAPTPEALAYREQYGHVITQQPAPLHGGTRGLRVATAEASRHDERKRTGAAA